MSVPTEIGKAAVKHGQLWMLTKLMKSVRGPTLQLPLIGAQMSSIAYDASSEREATAMLDKVGHFCVRSTSDSRIADRRAFRSSWFDFSRKAAH